MQVSIYGWNPTLNWLNIGLHPQGRDEQDAALVWPKLQGEIPVWAETLMVAHALREALIRGATSIVIDLQHSISKETEMFWENVHATTLRQYAIAHVPLRLNNTVAKPQEYKLSPVPMNALDKKFVSLSWPAASFTYNSHMLSQNDICLAVVDREPGDTCYLHCEEKVVADYWHFNGLGGHVPVRALKASCWDLADWVLLLCGADKRYGLNECVIVTADTAEANIGAWALPEDFRQKEYELVEPSFLADVLPEGTDMLECRDLDYYSSSLFAGQLKSLLASHSVHIEHCSPSSMLAQGTLVDVLAHLKQSLVIEHEAELIRVATIARQLEITDLRICWQAAFNPIKIDNQYLKGLASKMIGLDLFGTYSGLYWSIDNPSPELRAGPTGRCIMLNLNVRQQWQPSLRQMVEQTSMQVLSKFNLRIMDTELASLHWPFQLRRGLGQQTVDPVPADTFAVKEVLDLQLPAERLGNEILIGEARENTLPVFGLSTLRAVRDGCPAASLRIAVDAHGWICTNYHMGVPSFGTLVDGNWKSLSSAFLGDECSYALSSENFADLAPLISFHICEHQRSRFHD